MEVTEARRRLSCGKNFARRNPDLLTLRCFRVLGAGLAPSSPHHVAMSDSRAFAFGSSSVSGDWSQTLAGRADALAVYSDAVQEPDVECSNLDSLYCGSQHDDTDRAEARVLREDFCSSGKWPALCRGRSARLQLCVSQD
jgi:hypothetical protein